MNDSGLLDPETFTHQDDQYNAKLASGRVIATIDADWGIGEVQNSIRSTGEHERMYGPYPVTMSEDVPHADFQDTGYLGGWGIGISVDNKDPVAAIKFLDWLASDEGQVLNNWGIEGEHYEVIDGERVISDEEMDRRNNDSHYARDTGITSYDFMSPRYGDGVEDSTGQTYTIASPDQIVDSYTEKEKEVLEAYGAEMWMDLYPSADEFPIKPWGAGFQINTSNIPTLT